MAKKKTRSGTRSTSNKAQPKRCSIDKLSAELLDMILLHLKPSVSTRPFQIMDHGLPLGDMQVNAGWLDISANLNAMACFARTSKRYHAFVIPHLYQNILLPLRARTIKNPPSQMVMQDIELQYGRDKAGWPLRALRQSHMLRSPERAWKALQQSWKGHKNDWKHVVRLDLLGSSWIAASLPLLKAMPQVRELAIETGAVSLDGNELGAALIRMRKLDVALFHVRSEMPQILIAMSYFEQPLRQLGIKCLEADSDTLRHNDAEHWHDMAAVRQSGRCGTARLAADHIHMSCSCVHSIRQFLTMLKAGRVQTASLPSAPSDPRTILEHAPSRAVIQGVRRLTLPLILAEDTVTISEHFSRLDDLTLTWVEDVSALAFVEDLSRLDCRLRHLRFPFLLPTMLYALVHLLRPGSTLPHASVFDNLVELEVGARSLQIAANHWHREYKARLSPLLDRLQDYCTQRGIVLSLGEPDVERPMAWQDWTDDGRGLLDYGVDGSPIPEQGRPAQFTLWDAWDVFGQQEDDEGFRAIFDRIGHLDPAQIAADAVPEWQEEEEMLHAHYSGHQH